MVNNSPLENRTRSHCLLSRISKLVTLFLVFKMKLALSRAIIHSHRQHELLCLPYSSKILVKEWIEAVYNATGNLHVSTSVFHETHFAFILNEPLALLHRTEPQLKSRCYSGMDWRTYVNMF